MLVSDRAKVGTRKRLPNGFLQVDAVLARTGVQTYLAGELGLTDRSPGTLVRVYRDPADVFDAESMASFGMVPVTDNHPRGMVDAANARDLTVGWAGENITRSPSDTMDARLIISDKTLADAMDPATNGGAKGKEELSNGYTCDLVWEAGTSPKGEAYDAKQVNIRGNHIAVVDAGRCGAECRILDHGGAAPVAETPVSDCSCKGEPEMADKAQTPKVYDGFGLVEATDAAHAVIDSQAKTIATLKADAAKAEGEAAAKDAAHATALADKDAKIAELTAQIGDAATLDARVNARAKLVADAKKIGGENLATDGLADAAIKKAAVTAHMGADKVKDRDDHFFGGAFDYLVASDAKATSTADNDDGGRNIIPGSLSDVLRQPVNPQDKKPTSYEDRLSGAWKKGA